MRAISAKDKKTIDTDPFYKVCIHERFRDKLSPGRITIEHAYIYGGKQIAELWAYVPCKWEFNIDAKGNIKDFNKYIALLRCKELGKWNETKAKYSKFNWDHEFLRLSGLFGEIK